jgi:Flp pilus assembly protein TadD
MASILALAFFASPSLAAEQAAYTPQQLDDAYQQVLQNPQDRATLEQYARIAIALGNYEAAIPPMESLLMSNPDDADLKLIIGTLYMKLGSKLMARQYFEDAQGTPDVSQETKDKAGEYLREL